MALRVATSDHDIRTIIPDVGQSLTLLATSYCLNIKEYDRKKN